MKKIIIITAIMLLNLIGTASAVESDQQPEVIGAPALALEPGPEISIQAGSDSNGLLINLLDNPITLKQQQNYSVKLTCQGGLPPLELSGGVQIGTVANPAVST